MPENTTALISSAISPIGKLATRISAWLRGSRPRDPDPDLARPAARVRVQVDRQAGLRGGRPDRLPHLVDDRLGSVRPVEDDPGRQAELGHPHQLGDRLLGRHWQGNGSSMMNRPFNSSYNSRAQSLTARTHAARSSRVLDRRYLLIGAVDQFGVDPVPVHVFAAIFGVGGAEDAGLGLLRQARPGIAVDRSAADAGPADPAPRTALDDPLPDAVRPPARPAARHPGIFAAAAWSTSRRAGASAGNDRPRTPRQTSSPWRISRLGGSRVKAA